MEVIGKTPFSVGPDRKEPAQCLPRHYFFALGRMSTAAAGAVKLSYMVVFTRRKCGARLLLLLGLSLVLLPHPSPVTRSPLSLHAAPRAEVVVGAAANLTSVFQALGPRFEAETGIRAVFSFGSTQQLARQIENGAPIDVFAAADSVSVEGLEAKGFVLSGTRATYAQGVLALWVPPGTPGANPARGAVIGGVEDLARSGVRIIAAANPRLAPYGEAAVEAMKRAGVWDAVKSKIVYAENINMARQYGASGNADAVFTAYPLVMRERGTVLKVAPALYQPIIQTLAIVARTPNAPAARRFVEYLLRGNGRMLLKSYGYGLPDR